MTWLHTLQRGWLEFSANLRFRHLDLTILDPDRSGIVSIDFVDNPYHGHPDEDDGELGSYSPTDGTTTCHRYCTASVVSNGKPVTLALTYVRSDEKESDAVERVLDRVGACSFDIDLLLADRSFYNGRVIRCGRELATTVIPVQRKGERMKEKLETPCSYMTTYRMFKDNERELRFPLSVSVSYHNGDRGKHGEVVRGYVACDRPDRTPTQVERRYRKRSAIETSYRLFRQGEPQRRHKTTRTIRFRLGEIPVGESLVSAAMGGRRPPRRGGRDLPTQFTFSTFRDWIRHMLEQELERRREIERNGTGVSDAYGSAAG